MEKPLSKVFLLWVEPEEDYVFAVQGVVIITADDRFVVYCQSSNHNLYRSVLHKFQWQTLEHGVSFRGNEYRLTDITADIVERGWTQPSAIEHILRHLYDDHPKHFHFLKRHIQER